MLWIRVTAERKTKKICFSELQLSVFKA